MLKDGMKHVIKLPSEGQISVWTDDDMKYIDPIEPQQVQILLRALDHILHLKQNVDGDTRLLLRIAFAPPKINTT